MNASPISQRIHLETGRNPDINSLKRRDLRADFKRLPALLSMKHFFINETIDSHFSRPVTPTVLLFYLKRANLYALKTPDVCPINLVQNLVKSMLEMFIYTS